MSRDPRGSVNDLWGLPGVQGAVIGATGDGVGIGAGSGGGGGGGISGTGGSSESPGEAGGSGPTIAMIVEDEVDVTPEGVGVTSCTRGSIMRVSSRQCSGVDGTVVSIEDCIMW